MCVPELFMREKSAQYFNIINKQFRKTNPTTCYLTVAVIHLNTESIMAYLC